MNFRIRELLSRAAKPGPKTLAAKQSIRLNAFQHGLTGQLLILAESERPHYHAIARGFQERFRPIDMFEQQLLQKIIDTNWRLNVCAALENNLIVSGTSNHSEERPEEPSVEPVHARCRAWVAASDQFEKLGRYETGLHRRLVRMIAELERVQQARPAVSNESTEDDAQFDEEWEALLNSENSPLARLEASLTARAAASASAGSVSES